MSSDLESDDEALLIERLRAGCNRAAERLVRDHTGWMISVARRYVKEDALAEDCVQDAFLSAFSNIDAFEGRSSLKSWLHRITVNAALMNDDRVFATPIGNLSKGKSSGLPGWS